MAIGFRGSSAPASRNRVSAFAVSPRSRKYFPCCTSSSKRVCGTSSAGFVVPAGTGTGRASAPGERLSPSPGVGASSVVVEKGSAVKSGRIPTGAVSRANIGGSAGTGSRSA